MPAQSSAASRWLRAGRRCDPALFPGCVHCCSAHRMRSVEVALHTAALSPPGSSDGRHRTSSTLAILLPSCGLELTAQFGQHHKPQEACLARANAATSCCQNRFSVSHVALGVLSRAGAAAHKIRRQGSCGCAALVLMADNVHHIEHPSRPSAVRDPATWAVTGTEGYGAGACGQARSGRCLQQKVLRITCAMASGAQCRTPNAPALERASEGAPPRVRFRIGLALPSWACAVDVNGVQASARWPSR